MSFGYGPRGENGILGRRYFLKAKEKRTHHLHSYQAGDGNSRNSLDFKEYLIKHPEDAKSYGDLKLANQFLNDIHKYQDEKEYFVNKLVEKAIDWRLKRTSCC
ncbi:GrpB family protein [Niallia sp. JL1B1071]|uniref:GrpB family protein n=1 Tax=Niallia tiangongensis TaxID=3237105 RepID=UPI0037DCA1BE